MRVWTPSWDLTSIPDEAFYSEAGRRSNFRRKVKSGGVLWGAHRPKYSRCRCAKCMEKRLEKAATAPPKGPRGRPRIHPILETPKPKRPKGRPRKLPPPEAIVLDSATQ
jgi:hypothetical protein